MLPKLITSSVKRRAILCVCRQLSTQPKLTSEEYSVQRGNFNILNDQHLSFFESVLGKTRVLTDPLDLQGPNIDFQRSVRGASKLLLKPKTTEEVSWILKYCNEQRLAVCPQGGNTGLVGGSNPVFDEIVVSTSLMNQIISLDEWSDLLICQAGCVLETLNEYLMERNLIMPLDLGAKGSCNLGGNVSTNAGGLRLVRYGSMHSNVLGVEAVFADGTVMDCLSGMKKDNTGYDLKHLFIGSEGTLGSFLYFVRGFVTKVGIHCPAKPKSVKLALLGVESFEKVLQAMKKAKRDLSEVLSSCEYMDSESMDSVVNNLKLKRPIDNFPFYMLVETSGSNEEHDQEKLNAFLETATETGIVTDGTVAADSNQFNEIWALRERLADAMMADGCWYTYDFSIPVVNFNDIVLALRQELGSTVTRCCGFGHLGDGNIHLNVTVPTHDHAVVEKIEPFVFHYVSKHKGSISSEHGLGFKKRDYISFSKSNEPIQMMKKLKHLFDPNGILNPYKVLPD